MQKFKIYFWKYLPKGYFKDIKEKYKDRNKDYMNVYICDTFEEMYDLEDKLEGKPIERDYGARTWSYSKNYYDCKTNEYVKTSPCCGHIIFNKDFFYMSAITHEVGHAVIGYFSRKLKPYQDIFTKVDELGNIIEGEDECDINEELFCYMIGNMADQIACKYNENEKSA